MSDVHICTCGDCSPGWEDKCGFEAAFKADQEQWIARRDEARVVISQLFKGLKMMVELWDDNNPDDKCSCLGASDDCPSPGPCELCIARELITEVKL